MVDNDVLGVDGGCGESECKSQGAGRRTRSDKLKIIEGKFTHSGLQKCIIDGRLLAESTLFPSSGEAMLSGTLYHRGDLTAAVLV